MSIRVGRMSRIVEGHDAVRSVSGERPERVTSTSLECPTETRSGHGRFWFTTYRPHNCRAIGALISHDRAGWLLTFGIRNLGAFGIGWNRRG